MRFSCYVLDPVNNSTTKTTFSKLKEHVGSQEFLRMKNNLFADYDCRTKLEMVTKGPCQGFRRKPDRTGNHSCSSRGDHESITHQGNKEAIGSLAVINLRIGNETITVHPHKIQTEKTIKCNGRKYVIDVHVTIDSTEPERYKDLWHGELWIEVYHTCPVDCQQMEDFVIAHETLFETRIQDGYTFFEGSNAEQFDSRKKQIVKKYEQYGVRGILFSAEGYAAEWKTSPKGNQTAYIGDRYFTIVPSKKFIGTYGIVYDSAKGPTCMWKYNNQRFSSVDQAKKNAEHIAFLLYNHQKI